MNRPFLTIAMMGLLLSTGVGMIATAAAQNAKDLVNWQLVGYAIGKLDLGPAYRLEGGNIYSRGIWAPSLRYHNGTFLDAVLALVGFAFLAYTGWRTYADRATLGSRDVALEFLLPVWLTVGLLPCIYVLSLVITYDSALRGINWAAKGGRTRWRAWLVLVTGRHFRHRDVNALSWHRARQLVDAPTLSAARAIV